jgi:hypothetical protein
MGLRFRKSIRLLPGLRVNFGLKRSSVSIGRPGMTYNISSHGSRVTVGLPGSGISYSQNLSNQSPASLFGSTNSAQRRFSVTPIVIGLFVLGLLYIALKPTDEVSNQTRERSISSETSDVTGSISAGLAPAEVVPLPRPRPKPRGEAVGPPLQITPQQ